MHNPINVKHLFILPLLALLSSCDDPLPAPPDTLYESHCVFPYVRNDANFSSEITAYNNTAGGNYTTEVEALYRDDAGTIVNTQTVTLNPRESHQFSTTNFTGSVDIKGLGVANAMQCQLEIREVNNQSIALAQKATILERLAQHWFVQLDVTDEGPGQTRTALITANLWRDDPLYVRYNPDAPGISCAANEVIIPPRGFHVFYPMDVYAPLFPAGMQNIQVSVSGFTGPNATGQQVAAFSGAQFIADPGGSIALDNYATINPNEWGGISAKNQAYLVDVQDDGVNRTDRIVVKSTNGTNFPSPDIIYKVHMYDENGVVVPGAPIITLAEHFGNSDSYGIFSPMTLAGAPFSGSVWIEPPQGQNFAKEAQVSVTKQSATGWQDRLAQVAAKNWPSTHGVIPHVSNQEANRDYRLAFFYPENIYTPVPGVELPGDVFGGPNDVPPTPEGGIVVMQFYATDGQHLGWLAFQMQPNQTRYFDVDNIANTYLGENFSGTIEFTPHIAQQLELQHTVTGAHATTSNWTAGQKHY